MTYPIKGYPWRRNPVRSYEFHLTPQDADAIFGEVAAMPERYPHECLKNEVLWSDQSEKANGITRHRQTGKLCYTLAIFRAPGDAIVHFSMEEDSVALCNSRIYKLFTSLIAPHESIPPNAEGPPSVS
jgi:hypothetical protein